MDIGELLAFSVKNGASDLHLSAGLPPMIRVDGDVRRINVPAMQHKDVHDLVYDIMNDKQRKDYEEFLECDFSFEIPGLARFRVNAFNQNRGAGAVFRTIPSTILSLEDLKAPAIFKDISDYPRGVVLVTGPTGSGKSTTLAAMINHKNETEYGHILTIEDPIEYLFSNQRSVINQREVGADTASFHVGLRNGLRQAPDVIMIGELRDRETVSAALAYAHSGHLCLATLHASNSHQALHRLVNFFPPEVRPALLGDLAGALKAVISQRLLRTVHGGLMPAVEVLRNTQLVTELIEQGDFLGVKQAMDSTLAEGSQTFEQDLARLIASGHIERQEGMLHADSPTNLLGRTKNERPPVSGPRHPPTAPQSGQPASFLDSRLDALPADWPADTETTRWRDAAP